MFHVLNPKKHNTDRVKKAQEPGLIGLSTAIRATKSINQRLEDYWLGLRLQNMDIPAIQVVKSSESVVDDGLLLSESCELYLRLKGVGKDKVFIRTAKRCQTCSAFAFNTRTVARHSSRVPA